MPKHRTTGRRVKLIFGLAVVGALFATGIAFGAAPIVGTGSNSYTASTYSADQGEVVPFQVTGGNSHNVTATGSGPDGRALFQSDTISGGTTAVKGTQYLTTGNYTFICTIHRGMQATLVVSANGTPQARPHADLSVLSKKISKVTKRGLLVEINTNTKIDGVSLVAQLGKTTVGRANQLALAAGQQFEVLKLSKAGKNKLRGRSKATVTVTADIPFGSPATGKGKLK